MQKCDFNKAAKELRTPFPKNVSGGLLLFFHDLSSLIFTLRYQLKPRRTLFRHSKEIRFSRFLAIY